LHLNWLQGQFFSIDSLNKALQQAKNDNEIFYTLGFITNYYTFSNVDSALVYSRQAISLAQKMKSDVCLSHAISGYGGVLTQMGNYPQAIYFELEGLKLAEKINDPNSLGWRYSSLVSTYIDAEDYERALFYARKQQAVLQSYQISIRDSAQQSYCDGLENDVAIGFAMIYDKLRLPDSALHYIRLAKAPAEHPAMYLLANIYLQRHEYAKAIENYKKAYKKSIDKGYYAAAMQNANGLAQSFQQTKMIDSGIYYAKKVIELNNFAKYRLSLLQALELLSGLYRSKNVSDSTVKYLQLALSMKDSLFNHRKIMELQSMSFNEQLRQQHLQDKQNAYNNRIRSYFITGGLVAMIVILISVGLLFFYKYRLKQLQNLQRVKSRIASDLHDDIGATLTNINILAELSKQNGDKPANANTYLNRILEEISLASQALDDIVWSVNVRNDSLEEIISRMRKYAGELFDAGKTSYAIEFDEELILVKLNMEQRRDLYLLFKESVNNIYKHSAAENVTISITKQHQGLLMTVRDDGRGFKMQENGRNGLKNMESRVRKWKGYLRVETEQYKGTTLYLNFPVI
jgi:signal transduction histidine kinase